MQNMKVLLEQNNWAPCDWSICSCREKPHVYQ